MKNIVMELTAIFEPDPVPFSMETMGWKILGLLLLLVILGVAYRFFLSYKKNGYRRAAISKINSISRDSGEAIVPMITQLMFQIKQAALISYGRYEVASLSGSDWLRFLDDKAKGSQFSQYGEAISNAVYRDKYDSGVPFDRDEFVIMSKKWIADHA